MTETFLVLIPWEIYYILTTRLPISGKACVACNFNCRIKLKYFSKLQAVTCSVSRKQCKIATLLLRSFIVSDIRLVESRHFWWPSITFKVVHILQTFSRASCRPVVQQLISTDISCRAVPLRHPNLLFYYWVVILSVHLSVRLSVCLSHACFVTKPKNLPAIFLYHMKGQSL